MLLGIIIEGAIRKVNISMMHAIQQRHACYKARVTKAAAINLCSTLADCLVRLVCQVPCDKALKI